MPSGGSELRPRYSLKRRLEAEDAMVVVGNMAGGVWSGVLRDGFSLEEALGKGRVRLFVCMVMFTLKTVLGW
jgi:hypothetical protein